jgi:hypothetical protein
MSRQGTEIGECTQSCVALIEKTADGVSPLLQPLFILKVSDDGLMHFEESCFRTLSIVQCFSLKITFRKLVCFRLQVKGGGEGWHLLCGVPSKELVSIIGLLCGVP